MGVEFETVQTVIHRDNRDSLGNQLPPIIYQVGGRPELKRSQTKSDQNGPVVLSAGSPHEVMRTELGN